MEHLSFSPILIMLLYHKEKHMNSMDSSKVVDLEVNSENIIDQDR